MLNAKEKSGRDKRRDHAPTPAGMGGVAQASRRRIKINIPNFEVSGSVYTHLTRVLAPLKA